MIRILLVTSFVLLIGCSTDKLCSIQVEHEPIFIKVAPPQIQKYKILDTYFDSSNQVGFYGYNDANHSIDVFSSSKLEKSIKLSLEGPNKIDEIRGIGVLESRGMILISRNYIRVLDNNGNIVTNLFIPSLQQISIEENNSDRYHPNARPHVGLNFYFDESTRLVYLPVNNYSHPEWISPEVYQKGKRFVGTIHLDTGEFELLKIDYPEFLAEKLYGTLGDVNVAFDRKGNLIYGFDGFPDVFVYDLSSGEQQHLPNRENFIEIDPITDLNDLYGYSSNKVIYYKMIYNQLESVLYQIVTRPHPEGGVESYLRKFNSDFSVYGELKISKGLSSISVIIAPQGLYFINMMAEENQLEYINQVLSCD